MNTVIIKIAVGLWTAVLLAQLIYAQSPARTAPDFVIQSVAGRDLFDFYCASCHGRTGKGDGRVASALKTPPPDLTTMTERNKGTFPAAMVEDVIRGGSQSSKAAHGSSEMPVWGPIFKGLDNRNEINDARIENLVKYIESIQAKAKTE